MTNIEKAYKKIIKEFILKCDKYEPLSINGYDFTRDEVVYVRDDAHGLEERLTEAIHNDNKPEEGDDVLFSKMLSVMLEELRSSSGS